MTRRTALPPIPGYVMQGFIDEGATGRVYKAERDGRLFAIKIFNAIDTSPSQDGQSKSQFAIQFRKEAASLARIDHPGLVEVIEVGYTENQHYLVMAFVTGETLEQTLRDKPLPPRQILALAKSLTETLCEIHRHGIVHRDLKPANILIDTQGQSKIIDFGLAIENTTNGNESIGGTFLYSAPEQLGMIQHLMDGRADLYSLGCVLFECATGHPPYAASNLNQLLQILATQPPPSILKLNPNLEVLGLSQEFDVLIQRLLAKDPEDRFLNALQVLQALYNLTPESHSKATETHLEMPLIGRTTELNQLNTRWELTLHNKPQTLVIQAVAGIGKSRLVREFFQQTKEAVRFSSKCTMSARLPLGGLRQALDDFLKQTKALPEDEQTTLHKKIKKAVGDFGPTLKNFSRELALILSDVQEDIHIQSQTIYFESIAAFFYSLAKEFPALIFFIDDVQWIDDSSRIVLGKLNQLLKNKQKIPAPKLMIIATCRSGEEYQPALHTFQNELELDLSHILQLGPLNDTSMQQIARNHLGNRPVDSGKFLERILRISQGSPLALVEYLRVMLDSGYLYPVWGTWTADLSGMDSLHLPTDVIQLIVQRISALDLATKTVLQVAAILGSSFEKRILEKMISKNIHFELMTAVQANLLEAESDQQYSFVHDRIQEALISDISAEKIKALHTQAAETLDALPENEKSERNILFAMADHYYQGEIQLNLTRCYTSNLEAGRVSLGLFSLQEAIAFFDRCLEIHKKFNITINILPLLKDKADACLKCTQNREATDLLQQALELSTDPLEKGELYAQLIDAHLGVASMKEASRIIEHALKSLEVPLPKSIFGFILSILRDLFVSAIFKNTPYPFSAKDDRDIQKRQVLCRIYFVASYQAMTSADAIMMIYVSLRQFVSAYPLGPTPELARALSTLSILASGMKLKKYGLLLSTQAETLAQNLLDPLVDAEVAANHCLAKLVEGNYQASEEASIKCLRIHHQKLNRTSILRTVGGLMINFALRGKSQPALEIITPQVLPAHKAAKSSSLTPQMSRLQINACLGNFDSASQDLQVLLDYKIAERVQYDPSVNAYLLASLGMLHYEMDPTCDQFDALILRHQGINSHVKRLGLPGFLFFSVQMHNRIKKCLLEFSKNNSVERHSIEDLELAYQTLKKCSYPLTRHHEKIGQAALLWFKNSPQPAVKILTHAEQKAKEDGNPWARFEALKLKALILSKMKLFDLASEEAKSAFFIAIDMGWKIRAQRISKAYQLKHLLEHTLTSSLQSTINTKQSAITGATSPQDMKYKRYLDALLELNRSAAHTGDFQQQTRSALDEVIKILHAERGFLLLQSQTADLLEVQMARDAKQNDVLQIDSYSTSVVERVRTSRQPFTYLGAQADLQAGRIDSSLLTSKSIVAHQLRSVIAVPLIAAHQPDGGVQGVLYLDSTVTQGLFQEDDLAVLDAIAGYLTVNLEAAKSRQLQVEKDLLKKEQELTEVRLVSAHAAGMAEIASGAIHNIGNTLTGVLARVEAIKEGLKASKITAFIEGAELLVAHKDQLIEFITQNERGILLLRFFMKLGDSLKKESTDSHHQIEAIEHSIEQVQNVVLMQQNYAQVGLHHESVLLSKFIEDVLILFHANRDTNRNTHSDQSVTIEKKIADLPPVQIQKNKLLNVLMNLFTNALEAMKDVPPEQRLLRIDTGADPLDSTLQLIRISDNGCGIPKDKLQAIFAHGYSTKIKSLGFGLHTAANAMDEMGGKIEVESLGLNQGATFTLKIPQAKAGY